MDYNELKEVMVDLIEADEESVNCLLQTAYSMNPQYFEANIARYEDYEDEDDGVE